ncbi:unnamed protein product [Larinioides sclopetarius]
MKNNSVLVIFKNESVDYRKCTFGERFYLELLFQHNLLIETPLNQICGATWVFDFDGFDIHALLAWTPGWLRTTINFSVNSAPLRYKAMHVVNAPPIFSYTYNMVKPLFPKKIRERLFLHSRNDGWQNLHASIPVDILPKQYGGNICDENLISCLENVEEMERKFLKSFAFGSIKNQHRRKSMKVIC